MAGFSYFWDSSERVGGLNGGSSALLSRSRYYSDAGSYFCAGAFSDGLVELLVVGAAALSRDFFSAGSTGAL